jgi:hypothetical protein
VDTAAWHWPDSPDGVKTIGERLCNAEVLRGQERELAVGAGVDNEIGTRQSGQLAQHQM